MPTELTMNPALLQFGGVLAAFTLILYAVMSFLTGAAFSNGAFVRQAIEPLLKEVRSGSARKRGELADLSVLFGVGLALASLLFEQSFGAAIFALILWSCRAKIQSLTSNEHPLLSLGSQFSADLVVGLAAPLGLAHVLMGNPLLAMSHGAMVVALCWPAGGPGSKRSSDPGQGWTPSWVVS